MLQYMVLYSLGNDYKEGLTLQWTCFKYLYRFFPKSVVILEDNMLKHINGWEMSKSLDFDYKVYIKHFSGARTKHMKDYSKLSLREDPDSFILHVRPNDLSTERSAELIAKLVVDLVRTLQSDSRDVMVSNIIVHTNNPKLNEKVCEVNFHVK